MGSDFFREMPTPKPRWPEPPVHHPDDIFFREEVDMEREKPPPLIPMLPNYTDDQFLAIIDVNIAALRLWKTGIMLALEREVSFEDAYLAFQAAKERLKAALDAEDK